MEASGSPCGRPACLLVRSLSPRGLQSAHTSRALGKCCWVEELAWGGGGRGAGTTSSGSPRLSMNADPTLSAADLP